MFRVVAAARLGGEATPHPRPKDMRVIMPLSAWLQIADATMAMKLHKWISEDVKLTQVSFRLGGSWNASDLHRAWMYLGAARAAPHHKWATRSTTTRSTSRASWSGLSAGEFPCLSCGPFCAHSSCPSSRFPTATMAS